MQPTLLWVYIHADFLTNYRGSKSEKVHAGLYKVAIG